MFLQTAGFCVVTYILGVGDRHLDNLLVAPDGEIASLKPRSVIDVSLSFSGHFFHGAKPSLPCYLVIRPLISSEFLHSRLWLHSRSRPETLPAGRQSV